MTIQERKCPRCAAPLTFRLWRGRSLCANCKWQWPNAIRGEKTSATLNTGAVSPTTLMTSAQLERLRIYRAAVAHGFYTDQLPTPARARPADPQLS